MKDPEPTESGRQGPMLPWWLIAVLLILLGGGALLAAGQLGLGPGDALALLREMLDQAASLVKAIPPWAFVILLAVACAFPVPSSPFLIAAGLAYPPGTAIVAACIGLLGNIAISYLLSAHLMRHPIEYLVAKKGLSLPDKKAGGGVELILLVRFIPAIPLVFQSYLLGLLRVPFIPYLLISWPIACIGGIGLVLAGQGFYEGNFGIILLAASWLVVVTLAIKFVAKKIRAR